MTTELDRYCATCHGWHRAEVLKWDEHNFPDQYRDLEPCPGPRQDVRALRDGLARAAGHVFAIGVDAWQPGVIDEALDALSVNDPPEEDE